MKTAFIIFGIVAVGVFAIWYPLSVLLDWAKPEPGSNEDIKNWLLDHPGPDEEQTEGLLRYLESL